MCVNNLDSAERAPQNQHASQRNGAKAILVRSLRQRRILRSRDLLRMAPLPQPPR
jgi:hypothetical protein